MKKLKSILFTHYIAIAVIAMLPAACNKEDNKNEENGNQTIRFSIMEEDFGEDTDATRSSAEEFQPVIAELIDSEAEVGIENEPLEAYKTKTRAITTPTHYTIRVYKDGKMKGELKGIFSGSTFTPDAGTDEYIELPRKQTYDFVCFNDKVIPKNNIYGERWEISLADAATARIGRQKITIGATDQQVSLSAKHVGVRMRTQIASPKDIPAAITATIESTGSNIPQKVAYNPINGIYRSISNGTMAPTVNNSPPSTEPKYTASYYGGGFGYTSTSGYHYFLPTTDLGNLKLNITNGFIFWKTLKGTIPQITRPSIFYTQANSTWLVKINMKPQYTYLMSDGSTGFYKDTRKGGGSKTPIAVVIDEGQHIAVALQEVDENRYMPWCTGAYEGVQTNVIMVDDLSKALGGWARSGKEETWNPAYSTGSIGIKANNTNFPAFYYAAHYNPGVVYTGTPALQWYLPSYYDWKMVYARLGFGDPNTVTQANTNYTWYGELVIRAFGQVGGKMRSYVWTSSEFNAGAGAVGMFRTVMSWDCANKGYMGCNVRSFVKYR